MEFSRNTGIYSGGEGLVPVIQGNSICANTVIDGSGGGICCYGDTYPVIRDNEFRDNSALAYYGGAIHCEAYSLHGDLIVIERNVFMNNTAGGGGAVSFFNPYVSPPQVIGNEITANHATFGGGIYSFWSLAEVRGNAIRANHAIGTGDGLYMMDSEPTISSSPGCWIPRRSRRWRNRGAGRTRGRAEARRRVGNRALGAWPPAAPGSSVHPIPSRRRPRSR